MPPVELQVFLKAFSPGSCLEGGSAVAIALTVWSWGELSLNRSGVRKAASGVQSRAEGELVGSRSEACLRRLHLVPTTVNTAGPVSGDSGQGLYHGGGAWVVLHL